MELEKTIKILDDKINNLDVKINDLDDKLSDILILLERDIKPNCNKMDKHINFIESVYRGLRHPIDRVKTWFGG